MHKYKHEEHKHFYKIYELETLGSDKIRYEIVSCKEDDLQRLRVNEEERNEFVNRLFNNGWTLD